jgi:hypothetical protein
VSLVNKTLVAYTLCAAKDNQDEIYRVIIQYRKGDGVVSKGYILFKMLINEIFWRSLRIYVVRVN